MTTPVLNQKYSDASPTDVVPVPVLGFGSGDRRSVQVNGSRAGVPDLGPSGDYPRSVPIPTVGPAEIDARTPPEGGDLRRYWVGAALTATIATMVGGLGMLVSQGIFHETLVWPDGSGATFAVHVGAYALVAAVLSLLTSGLYAAIMHLAPRPTLYFGWIGALGVLFAVALPFTAPLSLVSQALFAGLNGLVGIAVVVLVPMAAARTLPTDFRR
jgi:hypothetical protein